MCVMPKRETRTGDVGTFSAGFVRRRVKARRTEENKRTFRGPSTRRRNKERGFRCPLEHAGQVALTGVTSLRVTSGIWHSGCTFVPAFFCCCFSLLGVSRGWFRTLETCPAHVCAFSTEPRRGWRKRFCFFCSRRSYSR